ncbi:D-2-hydroxyacid dehydrogenase [Dichotomicrobium thermohalophilum]|uniref:Glycerate dehydrogenase n=1 Tax=Dichotomicrobium thermohalophilum TaxID=933063 RepID=A0A397QDU5_9HYPH|nr:D-2-hydroxyacid dehydrogenase [Dichotomicrobium thermohalophilum]RIA56421.1 glycerate dehydrogenase [Dichotomicrobium thermohalophilum]
MTKIVFLDRKTIGPSVDLKRPQFPHEWEEYEKTAPGEVVERARDADIVITNKVPIDTDTLSQLPKLRMIAVAATGYDIIDVPACDTANVAVANVRGYAIQTVPEHVMALMLALSRSLVAYREDVIDGAWQRAGQFTFFSHPIRDLADQTLGIIGYGAIGESVARLASAFGMRILIAGRKGEDVVPEERTPFDQVIRESDIISLHTPLTPETRNLIARDEFTVMQRRPIIINTARGGLVNEADLVSALDAGQVRAIGFDCLTREPPAADNPLMAIADRPNVIITPHSAWASDTAMQTLWDQVIANIEAFQRGEPVNVVTPA